MNVIEEEMHRKDVSIGELADVFQINTKTLFYAIISVEKTKAAQKLCDRILSYLRQKGTAKRIPIPLPSLQKWILELKEQK